MAKQLPKPTTVSVNTLHDRSVHVGRKCFVAIVQPVTISDEHIRFYVLMAVNMKFNVL